MAAKTNTKTALLISVFFVVLVFSSSVGAQIVYVDADAPGILRRERDRFTALVSHDIRIVAVVEWRNIESGGWLAPGQQAEVAEAIVTVELRTGGDRRAESQHG